MSRRARNRICFADVRAVVAVVVVFVDDVDVEAVRCGSCVGGGGIPRV